MRLFIPLLALALAFFYATPSAAHRAKSCFSTMTYNDTESRFELVHQIHLHDAQFALNLLQNDPAASLFDLQNQARLLLVLEKEFQASADDKALNFTPIGAEIEGDHIYFYFESDKLAPPPHKIRAANEIFRSSFPEEYNQINIKIGPIVRTLIFRREGEKKEAIF